MDILRRRKAQAHASAPAASDGNTTSGVASASASTSSLSSATTAKARPKLQTDMTAASNALASTNSPVSSVDSGKSNFFQSYVPKAIRTLSRGSANSTFASRPHGSAAAAAAATTTTTAAAAAAASTSSSRPPATAPESPVSTSPQQHFTSQFPRNVLRRSHKRASSGHELLGRRGSTSSDVYSRVSRASTIMSGSSSSNFIDWRLQNVEKHAFVDYTEPQTLRRKPGLMAATADFIIIFRSPTDAAAAFPQLTEAVAQANSAAGIKPSMLPPAEPLHIIALHSVISIFRSDNGQAPPGLEIWWKLSYPDIAACSVSLFFSDVHLNEYHLDALVGMVKSKSRDQPEPRVCYEVEECIRKVFRAEEPDHATSEPEIFPVVYRNAPARIRTKADEKPKKGQPSMPEGVSSHFLVIGINLCFFFEIGRASAIQSTALEVRYQACGIVTLESFYAEWAPRDERFSIRFRDPFKNPVGLDLASRNYRRIILTMIRADKFLKPAWPIPLQTQEIFHVNGLPMYPPNVAGGDFGGFQRTLTAFCAAYRCDPVDWEISWRTAMAPEFRVLPPSKGQPYTDLQLLAVMRALRYNDYFRSLSFCDIDLSSLLDKYDSSRKGSIAYLSRTGVCLTAYETSLVQKASVLHQEFHALAFSSGKIRQIDFTNSLRSTYPGRPSQRSIQVLDPILNLLAAGLTRCNCIVMRGCCLGDADMESLVDYIAPSLDDREDHKAASSQEAVSLEVLDVSDCGLTDQSMKSLFQALSQSAWALQRLDISQNFGRVPAPMVQSFMGSVGNLRQLNLCGSLTGTFEGELLPFEALSRLEHLEELNLANFKLNASSVTALETFIGNLSARQASQSEEEYANGGYVCSLRRLVLNNCGITGHFAGQIFAAMAGLYDAHLHLCSNPLEEGIEDLVQALSACWGGRLGLHMDMVEFQDEENYIQLVDALTANRYVDYVSLVGTVPMPTADGTCSEQTCAALERFFRENQSVRYMDLSGFCGKLDDGQLGTGFGRALRGLSENQVMSHLRIRNQNLHDNVGALGTAIQSNTALRYLDCGDNGFNLTSLRFVVKSLKENSTILEYPFSEEEVEQVLKDCLRDMPQPHHLSAAKSKKKPALHSAADKQKTMLREEIEAAANEILESTSRNKARLEQTTGCVVDLDDAVDTGGVRGWPSLVLQVPEGMLYAGEAPQEQDADANAVEGAEGAIPVAMDEEGQNGAAAAAAPSAAPSAMPPSKVVSSRQSQLPVGSATVTPQATEEAPYRVRPDDEVLNSPVDMASSEWEFPMPPGQTARPRTEDDRQGHDSFSGKLFSESELAGLLETFTMEDGSTYVICGQT